MNLTPFFQRAATQPQFSPAWRDTAGAALSRIEGGAWRVGCMSKKDYGKKGQVQFAGAEPDPSFPHCHLVDLDVETKRAERLACTTVARRILLRPSPPGHLCQLVLADMRKSQLVSRIEQT